MDEEAHWLAAFVQLEAEVARLLGDEGAVRVGRCGRDVQPAGADLDEEQHVERLQERGLHGEEVAGPDAVGLSMQELAPGRTSPRGRAEAFAGEHPLDRTRPNANAELAQLALNPDTPPAWVVLGHVHDEPTDLRVERRTPSSRAPVAPRALHELAMPTQKRGRGDDARRPALPG